VKPHRNWYAFVGFLLGMGGVVTYFLLVLTENPTVHRWLEMPLLNLLLIAAGLALSGLGVYHAFARTHGGRVVAPLLAVVNLMLAGAFGWWLLVASYRIPPGAHAPAVGAVAPDFALPDERGNEVRLSSLRGKPVVLLFYRGFW
jgi:peroxiredoxin Q/BCP